MENTPTEVKKKTANDVIISMLHHINMDKKELAYKAVEEYLPTLARSGNYYYKIRNLLEEKPARLMQLSELPMDIKKLIIQSIITEDNVFLNEQSKTLIDELILEWKNKDVYSYHNLPVRSKILFHGATGNGKTTIARHIAKLTQLPFVEVNSDAMIDSHIGLSSMNIHKVFNQINQPCVLFWDEVDTIGRKRGRGDSAAGVENERMVNSMLVNMEKLSTDVIFIGATNRREVLDSAFLRRFDVQFELPAPTDPEKHSFTKQMVEHYKLPHEFIPTSIDTCISYSEIKLVLLEAARKYVITHLKNN